jgi:hypothetical protein
VLNSEEVIGFAAIILDSLAGGFIYDIYAFM